MPKITVYKRRDESSGKWFLSKEDQARLLDRIMPRGFGPMVIQRMIERLGSLENIFKASELEIQQACNISQERASRIYRFVHNSPDNPFLRMLMTALDESLPMAFITRVKSNDMLLRKS